MKTGKPDADANAHRYDSAEHRRAEAAQIRLAAIVESSDDAIIGKDLNSIITDWNQGAEKIFGYTAGEMVGASITRLIPADRQDEENFIIGKIRRGEKVEHFETLRQTKDGRLIHVSVTVAPIKDGDGNLLGALKIARDTTAQKEHEREFARITRLYAALSQVNQAIVWTPTRDELFQKVCKILVERGGFHMAWIGRHDPETREIVPLAVCGDERNYLRSIKIYADDRPEGRGPTGLAFRSGRPYICNDMLNNPVTLLWRSELTRRGFNASAAFPIRPKNEVWGTLTIYSDEPWFFQDQEIALLEKAAGDISFALGNFAEKEARRQVEMVAQSEQLFSATMIESMPGIIYFYDEQGRFLRWNRNFEVVSGYSGEEIARMHPLDFFSDREKASLKQRIADVFAKGESSVEASFVARDGRATPYFFTGRRVVFNGERCLVGMGVDISERKRAEQALRQSEGKLRALFEQAPLGIAVIDSITGQFLKINPQYCKIVGYSEAEMLASSFQQITHPDDLADDLANMNGLREGVVDAFQIEKRYICKDRSVVWVSLTCVPLGNTPVGEPQHIAMVEDITARKQSENRLAENEQKYRELVELANSIILRWNTEGKITFLNEFGLRFFGYAADEIFGRHVLGTIVPVTESSGRDLQGLMEHICADPNAFDQNTNENMRRSGERVWISWTNRILRDAPGRGVEILSVGTDITERRKASAALRASEDRYRTLFERAPDGIVIADTGGRYIDANSSICRMLGYAREELIGRHSSDIVVPAEIQNIAPALDAIKSESNYHREWQFRRKDGSVFPAEVIATMMPDGNILAMIRDITKRKRAELALRVLNQTLELEVTARTSDLQVALVRAEAADRIKSAFLATMSHELRTPLNSIIGFTGIVLQGLAGPLNAEQTKQLGMVRSSSRHLLELINDVLDLSKIEAGQLEVRAEPFNLRDSLERVTALVKPLAEKKGLALSIVTPPELGEMVSDRRRVEQILINLVNNAIKFTEHGSVRVTAERVADSKLPLDATPRPAVRVRVTDTGMGIKPEDLATLFQPFRQLDTGITRQHEGTGLGLVICRRLAALLGGEISARSEWSKGSEFTVTIPLQKPDAR